MRATVEGLGDFTTQLRTAVVLGQIVLVQGPFGRFRHRGQGTEIWFAAGIGITPFLTWSDALDAHAGKVILFYCVRSFDEAPHLVEIQSLAAAKPNLRLHWSVSSERQRLIADRITELLGTDLSKARVAYCGPASLQRTLQLGIRRIGFTSRRFRYESLEFRTGARHESCARWLMDKTHCKIRRS